VSWSDFHARIHTYIKHRSLLPRSAHLLIAVSGGQDSVCLAQILVDLAPRWDWQLTIAHCDHGWRDDSAENAAFVAQLAQIWGVPYCQRTANQTADPMVNQTANQAANQAANQTVNQTARQLLTSEAVARSWRYQQLVSLAIAVDAAWIVTGHTASDRAETVLHHLIRGTGSDGLASLSQARSLTEFCPPDLPTTPPPTLPQLVRPLLPLLRSETAHFCQLQHLPIWEDSTNADETYTRNRIRRRLLPLLRTEFNPQVETHLAQTAELLATDIDCLTHLAQELYDRARDPHHCDRLFCPPLRHAHPALQRRVIRLWLQCSLEGEFIQTGVTQVGQTSISVGVEDEERLSPRGRSPKPALNFATIEKVCRLLNAPNKTRTDPVIRARWVEVQGDWLSLKGC